MKRFVKETQYIALFLVVLTVATVFSYIDINEASSSARSPMESIKNEILAVSPKVIRSPAGVDERGTSALVKNFFCGSDILSEKVSQHLVMINFKICESEKQFTELVFVNESNGFKAQIFRLGEGNYKTDYIQLNEGVNKLKLLIILKDGQKRMESLEIVSGS